MYIGRFSSSFIRNSGYGTSSMTLDVILPKANGIIPTQAADNTGIRHKVPNNGDRTPVLRDPIETPGRRSRLRQFRKPRPNVWPRPVIPLARRDLDQLVNQLVNNDYPRIRQRTGDNL